MVQRVLVALAICATFLSQYASAANFISGGLSWQLTPTNNVTEVRIGNFKALNPWPSFSEIRDGNNWTAALPVCSQVMNVAPCLLSVSGRQINDSLWQEFKPGVEIGVLPQGFKTGDPKYTPGAFAADSRFGRPLGAYSRIWNSPLALQTQAGTSYFVGATVSRWGLNFAIRPASRGWQAPNPPRGYFCKWQDSSGDCMFPFNFPEKTEFQIKVLLGNATESNWFSSSIQNARITYSTPTGLQDGTRLLTVEGAPSKSEVIDVLPENPAKISAICGYGGRFDADSLGDSENFLHFKKCAEIASPKSIGQIESWRISNFGSGRASYNCFKKNPVLLGGVVSTNASIFDSAPPSWDANSSTLKYSIASTHFDTNGEINKGFYQLSIQENIAKCLWGNLGSAPQATVEVTSSSGTSNVATSSTALLNGYLYIDVQNFHYSIDNISIHFSPAAPTTPDAKSTKILCAKGKLIKQISGISPTCPAGYKQK
jgi:hypothetical protein